VKSVDRSDVCEPDWRRERSEYCEYGNRDDLPAESGTGESYSSSSDFCELAVILCG
jgi:hypothetical protein